MKHRPNFEPLTFFTDLINFLDFLQRTKLLVSLGGAVTGQHYFLVIGLVNRTETFFSTNYTNKLIQIN